MSRRLVGRANREASRLVDGKSGNEWMKYRTNRRLVDWSWILHREAEGNDERV